jgi:hypothetical protein
MLHACYIHSAKGHCNDTVDHRFLSQRESRRVGSDHLPSVGPQGQHLVDQGPKLPHGYLVPLFGECLGRLLPGVGDRQRDDLMELVHFPKWNSAASLPAMEMALWLKTWTSRIKEPHESRNDQHPPPQNCQPP